MHLKQALLHNTVWRVITMLFTFINNIIIVRLLGAETGAAFFYAIAIFTLLSTLLRLGLENGIIFFTSTHPERTNQVISFLGIIITIQTALTFAALKYVIPESLPYTLFWTVVFVTGNILIFYLTAFYQVKRMYISINISGTVIAFLQSLVLLSFYFSGRNVLLQSGFAKNPYDAVLIVLAAGGLLQVVWLLIYFYTRHKKDFSLIQPSAETVKRIFNFSLINFAGTVFLFLIMRADFYFVEKYCSSLSLGNYIQVAKIGQMTLVFPGLLGGVIFPFTVKATDAFAGKVAFFCRLLSFLFLILLVLFLSVGRYIFVWLLGPDFYLVYAGLGGSLAGVWCLAISLILISYFEGKNNQNIILISGFVTLIMICLGDILFVPRYGFMAAAIIFSIANFAGMLLLILYFIKKTNTPFSSMFLFSRADAAAFKFLK